MASGINSGNEWFVFLSISILVICLLVFSFGVYRGYKTVQDREIQEAQAVELKN